MEHDDTRPSHSDRHDHSRGETLLVVGRPRAELLERLQTAAADMQVVVGTKADDFAQSAPQATVILCWGPLGPLLSEVLPLAPQVRWVHIMTAGLDTALSAELLATPAVVTNGRGVFSRSLGEWVMAAVLFFAKDLRRLIDNQAAGQWRQFDVEEVHGRTIGIVGYGDIGRAVAVRARAMGMRVLGLTRRGPRPGQDDDVAERIFAPAERIAMLEQCDYVAVTAPLTPQTRGLIGEAELSALKRDAVIINVGRGPVIDEEALVQALSQWRIKGAALDVFTDEPLPPGHPFWGLGNVLLSPHSADHTSVWLDDAMQLFIDNLGRYRRGETLVNIIDRASGY